MRPRRGKVRGPLTRILRGTWWAFRAFSILSLVAFVVILLCLDLPAVRRLAVREIDAVLLPMFAGRIMIEHIDHLALTGIRGARLRIEDPEGTPVLLVDDASARVSLWPLARSVLFGKEDLHIDIADLRLGYVDANLDVDASGDLRLAKALRPKQEKPSAQSSRGAIVHLRRVRAAHAWLHGRPRGAPLVDADVDRLDMSALVGPKETAVDLASVEVLTRGMPHEANLRLRAEGHFAAPSKTGSDQEAQLDVVGAIGGIPVLVHGSLDRKEIAATVDVPRAAAETIRSLVPGAPVYAEIEAHAEAHGHLPEIEASARATLGKGIVTIQAHVTAAEEIAARATVTATHIDTRTLAPTAPSSSLGARATVELNSRNGDTTGRYSLDVLPGTMAGSAVPSAHVHGELEAASGGDAGAAALSISGTGTVAERGAPTSVDFHWRQKGSSSTLGFEVDTSVPRLDATRFGPSFTGSLSLRAHGTMELGRAPSVDTDVIVRTSRVQYAGARLDHAWLHAHVRGPSADPMLDAIFQGNGVAAGGVQFASTVVTARGRLGSAEVTLSALPVDGPRVEGRARVLTGEATVVRDARLRLSRDDVHAVIDAATVRVDKEGVRAEGIAVEGLGDPIRAEGRRAGPHLFVRASTNELDLARLSRLLKLRGVKEGHLGLDVDLAVSGTGARGHARVDLGQAVLGSVRNGSAHLDANFDGRSMTATAHARLGRIGRVDLDPCRIEIDGTARPGLSAWKGARGNVAFDSEVDIARVRALLPRGTLPFDEMQGMLRIEGDVARHASGPDVPQVRLSARTKGLLLSGRGEREQLDGTRIIASPPWRLEGVDVDLSASIDEHTGAAALTTRLLDRQGTLASLDVSSSSLPYGHWLRKEPLSPASLDAVRLQGELGIPARDLASLPSILDTQQVAGQVAAQVNVGGTALEPTVHLDVRTQGVTSSVSPVAAPIDAKIFGQYENGAAKIDMDVSSAGGQLLLGSIQVDGSVTELLQHAHDGNVPWEASTRLRLEDFPLETLTLLTDMPVRGRVSGELALDDVHKDGRAKADVTFRDLRLGRVKFPLGSARAEFDGTLLRGAVRLDQADGFLQTEGQVGMFWGKELLPRTTDAQPAFASVKAHGFRIGALLPLVPGILSELDGLVEADARIDVGAGATVAKMGGTVELTDGRVQLTRVGEPFHGVAAKLALTPDGLIRLTDATASASSGTVMASGVARLNGFKFVGARATIRIPNREAVPLEIDGEAIGDVDGEINVKADMTPDQRALKVDLDIPRLHTDLPLSSTHEVQDLGEAEDIRIGYFRRQDRFVVLPMDAEDLESKKPSTPESPSTPIDVAIHLGSDVVIKRGTTLRVLVDGDPMLHITDKARMSGQVRLRQGIFEVQGKRFEIERGTVSFVGDDPSNPQVVVTAGWTAPDGTRVYADFTGPLKTGKVVLRSEPARSQDEILALIMFGTAEGSGATPYPSPQPNGSSRAGTFATSFATEGLSRGLDKLTGLEVSARINTTNAANPSPELRVQIARDISLQIAYVLGTPPPGTNPDKTLLTLDWRFKRNWSMAATFGDQGSSIMDMIWQYRY